MVGALPSVPPVPSARTAPARTPAPAAPAEPSVPFPRRPLEAGGTWERVRWWYESVLGWPTAPGTPVRLRAGLRFDVLDVPAEAGHAALERLGPARGPGPAPRRPGFPVAVRGERMLLLVAAGGAEEMPGLLEWLEWGSLPLDLTAVGAGGLLEAPLAPEPGSTGLPPRPPGRDGLQGAAVWLRAPEPGCEVEASLPTLSAVGGAGTAPDLARLVRTLATQCHRVRLSQPPPPSSPPSPSCRMAL
ncbi:SCO3374 family protein [Streptomyces sp. NPDC096048]|uniref:SCO3374 family protein n=1 Tax=Streptomyces sp. NPDC096048 TaxID=3366072 RepID=UPI003826E393